MGNLYKELIIYVINNKELKKIKKSTINLLNQHVRFKIKFSLASLKTREKFFNNSDYLISV